MAKPKIFIRGRSSAPRFSIEEKAPKPVQITDSLDALLSVSLSKKTTPIKKTNIRIIL